MPDTRAVAAAVLLVALTGCGGLGGDAGPGSLLGDASPSIETVSTPASVTQGEEAAVVATVRQGVDADGTAPLSVAIRVDGRTVASENRSVSPGDETTVTASLDTATLDPGEYEIAVSAGDVTETRTLVVERARPATFAVAAIDAPETVGYGDDLVVDVTVRNRGDRAGTRPVTVRFGDDGNASRTLDIALDGGASATRSVTLEAVRGDEGDHRLVVETPNETRERTAALDHPSPYGRTALRLYVDDETVDRNVSDVVAGATGYWERNDERYLGYPVAYERVDEEDRADVVLRFDRVERCGVEGNDTRYFGCADLLVDEPRTPMTATVDPRISDAEMNATIAHELGHVQGLEHGAEPAGLMAETSTLATHRPVKVHLRADDGAVTGPVEDEVAAALDYFAGRDDLAGSDEFAWEFVDEARDAHVQITDDERGDACFADGGGSCTVEGEYYGQEDVRLEALDDEVVAWHVGTSLAPVLLEEVPPELTGEAERREREEWPE